MAIQSNHSSFNVTDQRIPEIPCSLTNRRHIWSVRLIHSLHRKRISELQRHIESERTFAATRLGYCNWRVVLILVGRATLISWCVGALIWGLVGWNIARNRGFRWSWLFHFKNRERIRGVKRLWTWFVFLQSLCIISLVIVITRNGLIGSGTYRFLIVCWWDILICCIFLCKPWIFGRFPVFLWNKLVFFKLYLFDYRHINIKIGFASIASQAIAVLRG